MYNWFLRAHMWPNCLHYYLIYFSTLRVQGSREASHACDVEKANTISFARKYGLFKKSCIESVLCERQNPVSKPQCASQHQISGFHYPANNFRSRWFTDHNSQPSLPAIDVLKRALDVLFLLSPFVFLWAISCHSRMLQHSSVRNMQDFWQYFQEILLASCMANGRKASFPVVSEYFLCTLSLVVYL